eukprot:gene31096-6227_t
MTYNADDENLIAAARCPHLVQNFPFPTPPEPHSLKAAEACLVALSALEPASSSNLSLSGTTGAGHATPGALTPLGRAMAAFPISPRHSRMLLEVSSWQQQQLREESESGIQAGSGSVRVGRPSSERATLALPYALALAAALSVEHPFVQMDTVKKEKPKDGDGSESCEDSDGGKKASESAAERARKEAARQEVNKKAQHATAAHARFKSADSDALAALNALCAFEAAGETDEFCKDNFMHARNLREAADLHRQLVRTLATVKIKNEPPSSTKRGAADADSTTSAVQDGLIFARQAVAACKDGSKLLSAVIRDPFPGQRVQDALRRAHGWDGLRGSQAGLPNGDSKTKITTNPEQKEKGRLVADSAFADLRPLLLAAPATAAKTEMRCVARVGELVGALQRRGIDSRASLAAAW